jgi:hypothetical protein
VGVAHAVGCLPSKYETLSSNPGTEKEISLRKSEKIQVPEHSPKQPESDFLCVKPRNSNLSEASCKQ